MIAKFGIPQCLSWLNLCRDKGNSNNNCCRLANQGQKIEECTTVATKGCDMIS
ncbi:hypothetical protein HMI54_011264, partial [Coelomomyces lativittatus]